MERNARHQSVTTGRTRWRRFALRLAATIPLILASAAHTAPGACNVPDDLDEAGKRECVKRARILLPQPRLSLTQIQKGPDFDPKNPQGSRHRYFEPSDDVLCYFRPHYAFKRVQGQSLKFHCWRLTEDRRFLDPEGSAMNIDGPRIEIRESGNGEKEANIVDSSGKRRKPDRIKVKYLRPPHPDHDRRYHEVFTEVAVTRIVWALGIPADHMYGVQRVRCVGCEESPFRRHFFGLIGGGQTENTASLSDAPQPFELVTVDRKHPFDEIEADTEYWSWTDAAQFYQDGTWDDRQRAEYDAYRLALGLVFYHNDKEQQNRVACAREGAKGADVCLEPYIFVQDLGSTFGSKKNPLAFWTANPRGEYRHWKDQTVFTDPARCVLRAALGGPAQVSREGQALLAQRLGVLTRTNVEAIFTAARFDRMDQTQLARLRDAGAADPGKAALREWTDTFLERVAEVQSARSCASMR